MTATERTGLQAQADDVFSSRKGQSGWTVEWGYRIGEDPYVVEMSKEKYVREIAQHDPGVTIVRRFITEWEPETPEPAENDGQLDQPLLAWLAARHPEVYAEWRAVMFAAARGDR